MKKIVILLSIACFIFLAYAFKVEKELNKLKQIVSKQNKVIDIQSELISIQEENSVIRDKTISELIVLTTLQQNH